MIANHGLDLDRMMDTETIVRDANSVSRWDLLWGSEETRNWRGVALAEVYERIAHIVPGGSLVTDIGGGVGYLADILKSHDCQVNVIDHSPVALSQAAQNGHQTQLINLENAQNIDIAPDRVVVATEVIEHLTAGSRHKLLQAICGSDRLCLLSVPNNCLGPDEEPQHLTKFTALGFKQFLKQYFNNVRIECMGRYLLGICGQKKSFTLSVCFPARDEAKDIERTLASFMGAADEIVIGVDPRTEDNTREIAKRYADIVFDLKSPEGVGEDKVSTGGVHFAHIRNQCIERCSGDWIFMTEAHEHLAAGLDSLLRLDSVPDAAQAVFVLRRGYNQQWGFPWLFRPHLRFKRSTHNVLDYPVKTFVVKMTSVITYHDRDHKRALARQKQRRTQNRKVLFEDWLANNNENSLYYLGSEWRDIDPSRAISRLEQFLATSNNGPQKYQATLVLAREYMKQGRLKSCRETLIKAVEYDWTRSEHWVWLGDLAFSKEKYAEAVQWYEYAATTIGRVPFTTWWLELHYYSYIPAQRLAMTYSALGQLDRAHEWAARVVDLLPEDAPEEIVSECKKNLDEIKEAGHG